MNAQWVIEEPKDLVGIYTVANGEQIMLVMENNTRIMIQAL